MKATKETNMRLKIKGDDILNLKSAIGKVVSESSSVGFKSSSFSNSERDVLIKLSDTLNK